MMRIRIREWYRKWQMEGEAGNVEDSAAEMLSDAIEEVLAKGEGGLEYS